MILDSTILVDLLRDKSGQCRARLEDFLEGNDFFITRFTQFELMRGCLNEAEWTKLQSYLSDQYYVEASDITWAHAARIYYELRRKGKTLNSANDCCIAQIAIENNLTVIHNDQNFEVIAGVRSLRR